jgi:hypothetical protein
VNEDDLLGLASIPRASTPTCRPIDDVVGRGTTLRRRRRAVQAIGATAVVGGFAMAGVLTVREGRDTTTNGPGPSPSASLPRGSREACEATETPARDADLDGLRFIPTWPEGVRFTDIIAKRAEAECAEPQPALSLLALRGDTVEGSVLLHGPFATEPPPWGGEATTTLRGVEASMAVTSLGTEPPEIELVWREPDGGYWWLIANAIDQAVLRQLVESLILDSRPDSGPAAVVPPGALPDGWIVTWQAPGLPEMNSRTWHTWTGAILELPCTVNASNGHGPVPAIFALTARGSTYTEVRGRPAVASYVGEKVTLRWTEDGGVWVDVTCDDLATARQVAESLRTTDDGGGDPPPDGGD